jgi:hypothetical protein
MTSGVPGHLAAQDELRALSPVLAARGARFRYVSGRARHRLSLNENRIAIVLLGLLAAFYLYGPLWRALLPLEMSPNEAWNAWYASAVLKGEPLYPGRGELIVNNYPPLSFYLVALVSLITSDVIYAGRFVSFLSLGAVAFSIGLCIRQLGGSRRSAAFGGLWFVATMACFFSRFIAIDDPNMLALATMGGALAFFLARLSEGKSVEPAVACMVLAGFFKHSLIAIPLTALIWLTLTHWRLGLRAALFGAGLAALGLAVCLAVYGGGFLDQLLMPRVLSIGRALRVVNKIQWVAPALLCWGIWAWSNREKAAARFSALLVAISYATSSLQTAGDGVVLNAFFELIFASSVAVALAFEHVASTPLARRFSVAQIQRAIIAVLVLRLLLSQHLEPYLMLFSPEFRQEAAQKADVMNSEVERVRAIPGAVSCSNMTVCFRAGKTFVYDPFWVGQKLATGTSSQAQMDDAVARAQMRFETIDPKLAIEKKRLFLIARPLPVAG